MAKFGMLYSRIRFITIFSKILPSFILKRGVTSSPYRKNFLVRHASLRKIHISLSFYEDNGNLAVSHLAVQELAISSFRRLQLEVNKFKRAKISDIESVLKGDLKDLLTDGREIVFLLRCCGSLLRNENVMSRNNLIDILWKKICHSGIPLSSDYFTALLETYVENNRQVSPKKFLNDMKRHHVEPSRETLIKLLLCSRSDMGPKHTMDNLVEIVEELKSRGHSADTEMFEALASTLAEAGDLSGAEDIVETMIRAQLEPTATVYTSLINGYIKLEDKLSILKVLNEMEKRNLSMLESHYVSVIEKFAETVHLSERNGTQFAKEISNLLPLIRISEGESILHCISNAVLALVNEKKEDVALSFILSLPSKLLGGQQFLEPLPILFSKEVVKADCDAEKVIKICDQLESLTVPLIRVQGFLEPYLLHAALGLSMHLGKKKLNLLLLNALFLRGAVIRPHYFWPILCTVAKEEDSACKEKEILMVLKNMTEMRVEADYDTLGFYILPFLDKKLRALGILTVLKEYGSTGIIPRTAITCYLILNGDLQQATNFNSVHHGKINSALVIEPLAAFLVEDSKKPNRQTLPNMVRLLNLLQAKGDKGVDYVGLLLLELCEKVGFMTNGKDTKTVENDLNYILSVLRILDLRNMRISQEAEEALLYFLQPKLDLRGEDERELYIPRVDSTLALSKHEILQNRIPHPREMTLIELESHLVELRSKGLNERGVLRRLLQIYCRLGNLDKALKIKQALESQGHSFSAGMLSSLLDLYLKQSMLKESEEMYLRIRKYHPTFKVDDHKVLDIATLLSKCGRIKDALDILEEHSHRVQLKPGQAFQKNVLLFLKSVHISLGQGSVNDTEKPNIKGPAAAVKNDKIEDLTVQKILKKLIDLEYVTNPPSRYLTDFAKETEI